MSKNVLEASECLTSLDFPIPPKPATLEEIEEAQKKLGIKFADDFVQVLLKYGQLDTLELTLLGLTGVDYEDVVETTLSLWECDETAHKNMYAIQNFGIDGLMAWQDENGVVYGKRDFYNELDKWADSLAEYILTIKKEYDETEGYTK